VGIVVSVITPYMINPSAWNLGNFTALVWAGMAALSAMYCFFRLPEPRGRTFAELDMLFEQKISARKFATTKVDVFEIEDARFSGEEKLDVDHIEKEKE
jgi:SP family general alpha glucoside:H+ symporter-like MFS transporter